MHMQQEAASHSLSAKKRSRFHQQHRARTSMNILTAQQKANPNAGLTHKKSSEKPSGGLSSLIKLLQVIKSPLRQSTTTGTDDSLEVGSEAGTTSVINFEGLDVEDIIEQNVAREREERKRILQEKYEPCRQIIDQIADRVERQIASYKNSTNSVVPVPTEIALPENMTSSSATLANTTPAKNPLHSLGSESRRSSLKRNSLVIIKAEKYFSGRFQPGISLNDYFFRLVRYLDRFYSVQYEKDREDLDKLVDTTKGPGLRSLLVAHIYVHRITEKFPEFQITRYNVHRLYLVGMLVSCKFAEDKPISLKYWAKVGGIKFEELVVLEQQFCAITEFDLNIDELEIDGLRNELTP